MKCPACGYEKNPGEEGEPFEEIKVPGGFEKIAMAYLDGKPEQMMPALVRLYSCPKCQCVRADW